MPKWLSRYQIGIGYKCRNQQEIEGLSELLERECTRYMSLHPESGNSLLLSWHCNYFEAAVQMTINHICKGFNTVLASNTIVIIKMKWIFLFLKNKELFMWEEVREIDGFYLSM